MPVSRASGAAMKRREFIILLGGAAAWPLAARAQQAALPIIGFLRSTSLADATHLVTAFRNGLEEVGFVEGQNVIVEYRSANDQPERLPVLVADLIGRQAAVIVGNTNAALAAKAATKTVPIVFATGTDPVRDGLVASLNRPGGNVTGVTFLTSELGTKRLDLVRELVPTASTIAMLVGPDPEAVAERQAVKAAAQAISQQLIVLDVNSEQEIDTAFATFVQRGAGALLCGSGAFLNSHRDRAVALAARYALPTIYVLREYVLAGG
jgi:putative tryptophan/tyrosine transport system substrate-binding protein